MAHAKNKKTKTVEDYEFSYKKDYQDDWDIHRNYIQTFDAYEAMLQGYVYDSVSSSINGSKITDSYASTLAIERAARVMGKLPEGTTESVAKADQGKAAFMDILRQKWIYPNANSQHSLEIKLRLWQLYSSVYGYMPMFYDWNISTSGYVGPDCWLWNPRNLIPQQGRTSIRDMDYVTALTWVGKSYIEGLLEKSDEELEEGGWNKEALDLLVNVAGEQTDRDNDKDTLTERTRTPEATKKGICLATRYEAGEDGQWCTFAPDHSYLEVRKLDNPHKNGRIPFVIKYSQPLFDSFYGMGDFQRAKPLQFARDGLTNFYFKGIKMNLIPPIVVNANGVLKHTIDYREGAVMSETIPNSIRRLETSNAGLATYQGAQTALTGSLLALYGSQNASIPGADALNPSQGRTPAAISMYSDKEATRDGQEREYLEQAIEELTDGFFSLVANIGTESIPVNLFSGDIEAIHKSGLTDVLGLFTNQFKPNSTMTGGELKIDPTKLKDIEYRFTINRGSTAKMNKEAQNAALDNFIGMISKLQNVLDNDPNVDVNWGKIMEVKEALTDIPGVAEFITVREGPSKHELEMQQQIQQQEQAAQQHQMKMAEMQQKADTQGQMDQMKVAGQAQSLQPDPQQPTVNGAGAYMDPTVAEAANALSKL